MCAESSPLVQLVHMHHVFGHILGPPNTTKYKCIYIYDITWPLGV
jgi:hypothetical protein